jgi:hypothetical protein
MQYAQGYSYGVQSGVQNARRVTRTIHFLLASCIVLDAQTSVIINAWLKKALVSILIQE